LKIQVLGIAPGNPVLGQHHSAVFVNFSNNNVLLDCGESTSQQLLRNKMDGELLDAIAISHYHPDHVSGLFMVLQMLYLKKRVKPLKLFLPEEIEKFKNVLELFYVFPKKLTFKLELYPIQQINHYFPEIKVIFSEHLYSYKDFIKKYNLPNPMNSYSYYIKEKEKRFIFTSDIEGIKSFNDYLHNLDLLIIDGMHPDAKDILNLPSKTNARILITHGLSEELEQILEIEPNKKLEFADEKTEIII